MTMQPIMYQLAQAAYSSWAENKNVDSWENLPDWRRYTWRKVARAVVEEIEEINKGNRAERTA